jgi:putative oxidoreductase
MTYQDSVVIRNVSPVRRGRGALVGLWAAQVVLAAMFLLAGGSKLASAPQMVALFDAVGVGQWFRYATGTIEVTSAIALLVPALAPFGAMALAATMAGAIAAHLFVVGGSPAVPAVLLIGSASVAWARRNQLRAALGR